MLLQYFERKGLLQVQGAAATRGQGLFTLFLPLRDPDKTGFGPHSQARKFPVVEFSLLSQQR